MSEISHGQLRSAFVPNSRELVGLEVESAVVDPETGRAAHYLGVRGVRTVLETALSEWGGRPLLDTEHLIGLELPDGSRLSLEHGGQLEYSGAPMPSLASAVKRMREVLTGTARLLDRLGLALLPGGYVPFDTIDTISWVPLGRNGLMRSHFSRLGGAGSDAPRILGLSLSTQVHLDYLSEEDFTRKLRMQAVASPVVAALLVNSPLADGRLDGLLSHRSQAWLRTDPERCNVLPPAVRPGVCVDDFVDWALGLSMLYYIDPEGEFRKAPDRPFRALLRDGFDDGTVPTLDHWNQLLDQIWTHVRVRRTLELRAADGPAYRHIPAFAALWVGLTYHAPSRDAAWDLLGDRPEGDYQAATSELPAGGLRTKLGKDQVGELAAELLRLARQGLRARVDAGVEPPSVLGHLDPLEEILHTGETFAEQCARRWVSDFKCDPGHYVRAYRV